ncbi:MAG TPA: hypothetical protein VIH25_11425 [Steroidobacteraceae bacterium]
MTYLRDLLAHASSLGFDEMTPIMSQVEPGSIESLRGYFWRWAEVIAVPDPELESPLFGDVTTATGFGIYPGRGCEAANFGFLHRAEPDGSNAEWFWHHCCKTQYASLLSWDHLIRCHTSLVALLDYAIERGIDVVRDEGHYWETRDKARLVAEVDYMNKVVAALAGRLGDAIERTGHTVGAPIFEHREFEHLEMEPKTKPE